MWVNSYNIKISIPEAVIAYLDSHEEARAYLAHLVLGIHLREVTNAVLTHKSKDIGSIMGGSIDALKLCSSMTLFDAVSPNDIFRDVPDAFYKGKGDARSLNTIHQSNA